MIHGKRGMEAARAQALAGDHGLVEAAREVGIELLPVVAQVAQRLVPIDAQALRLRQARPPAGSPAPRTAASPAGRHDARSAPAQARAMSG